MAQVQDLEAKVTDSGSEASQGGSPKQVQSCLIAVGTDVPIAGAVESFWLDEADAEAVQTDRGAALVNESRTDSGPTAIANHRSGTVDSGQTGSMNTLNPPGQTWSR